MVKRSWTVAAVRKAEEKAVREVGEMVKKMVEERVSLERALKKAKKERVGMEEVRKKVNAAMRKMEERNKAEGDRMRAEEEKKMMEMELENLQTKNRSMFEELELLRAETEVYQTIVSPDHSQPSSQGLLHSERRLTPQHTKLLSTRDKQEDDTGNGPASKRFRI